MSGYRLVVGGITRPLSYAATADGQGISVFEIDGQTGLSSLIGVRSGIDNPTFVAVAPGGGSIAAVSEIDGWNEGLVTLYAVDAATGRLRYRNRQATRGSSAAHACFDRTGQWLATVNYGEPLLSEQPNQAVALFPVERTGELGASRYALMTSGTLGPNRARQDRNHPHCARWTPDNRFMIVADLGLDSLFCYRFDPVQGSLSLCFEASLPPGSGPRHVDFDPISTTVYVVNELSADLASFRHDAATGALDLLGISAIADGRPGCSAVCVEPGGRRIFVGDRGGHGIATFEVDPVTRIARFVGWRDCGGLTPRDMALSPDGALLAVANQDSGFVSLFSHEASTGRLQPFAEPIRCGTPTSVAFIG